MTIPMGDCDDTSQMIVILEPALIVAYDDGDDHDDHFTKVWMLVFNVYWQPIYFISPGMV
jgi:hypothetical protein